jgi:hypothetical protein
VAKAKESMVVEHPPKERLLSCWTLCNIKLEDCALLSIISSKFQSILRHSRSVADDVNAIPSNLKRVKHERPS